MKKILFSKLRLGAFSEIPLYLHSSFILFFGALMSMLWLSLQLAPSSNMDPFSALLETLSTFSIVFIAYISVILHEYGHALTAKKCGYLCADITLYPIGGMASIPGNWYENWRHEFWITVNGPMVNVVLALMAAPFAIYLSDSSAIKPIASSVLEINCILLAFNLLPLHPMDGGRIMRSVLNGIMGCPLKSTILARRLTVVFAIVLIPLLWVFVGPFAACIVTVVALFLGKFETQVVVGELIAKKSKQGGHIQKYTDEWGQVMQADVKFLFPNSDTQDMHLRGLRQFHEWMGKVHLILASHSSSPEEVQMKAEKVMECLRGLKESERMAFNTIYFGLDDDDADDPGFQHWLTEKFLKKHNLI